MLKLFLAIAILSLPSAARAYCSEPSAPYCASSYGQFDDQWEFDRCKREVENYASDVERYIDCRSDEANEAVRSAEYDRQNAISEYNNTVDSFNRRARSGY